MKLDFNKRESIGNQIFWLVTTTTLLAVLIISVTNIAFNVLSARKSKVSQTQALAEVIAQNSTAALSFDQSEVAEELLSSLQSRPTINDAIILDALAKPFATYKRDVSSAPRHSTETAPGHSWLSGELEMRVPINEFDEAIGTLIVHSSTSDIRNSVFQFIVTSSLISILVLGLGIWLAAGLQKTISKPIMDLSQTAAEISGKGDYSLRVQGNFKGEIGQLSLHFNEMLQQIEDANQSLNDAHQKLMESNEVLEENVEARTKELALTNQLLQQEVEDKIRANQELKDLQSQLIDTSRQAGMAEIANGVLHNVGNVLNSVNVSSTLIGEKIRELKVESLIKASKLLETHADNLPGYFANDPRACHFPGFLKNLAGHLGTVQESTISEVESLNNNIAFIKDVIQAQQSFAGNNGVITTVQTDEIFDDAFRFVGSSFDRHAIKVEKDYQVVAALDVDKSKLLQILTNFIKNAREALNHVQDRPRVVLLEITQTEDDMIEFSVTDNGTGIEPANLPRIFSHGFTTKEHGHGFGLHSAAISAREMKGQVNVRSNGVDRGATFSVKVPAKISAKAFPNLSPENLIQTSTNPVVS